MIPVKVLGLDPSLTNFGWAVHDTDATGLTRCIARGRFQTGSSTLFVDRYVSMRESLRTLIQEVQPDRMGIEFPVFDNLFSEGMYGLFLYSCEAIKLERQDIVFWSPLQVKAHAREAIGRPKGWEMMKPDMVEAAKKDTGFKGRWNHNEADAYLVARLSARFWLLHDKVITEDSLSLTERQYFKKVHTFEKGKRAGETVQSGVMYRENERFFRWSQLNSTEVSNGEVHKGRSIVFQSADAGVGSVEEDPEV